MRRAAGTLSIVLLLAAAPARAADPSPKTVREAQQHYRKGDDAFRGERYEEAYREFEQGFALVPRPLFVLNMAHAQRRRGELRSALALYRRFLVMDAETKLRGDVEAVIRELEAAIAADDEATRAKLPAPVLVPAAPSIVDVSAPAIAPEPKPLLHRWWFWAGVGAIVAAGVVTATVLASKDDYRRQGSLGSLGQP